MISWKHLACTLLVSTLPALANKEKLSVLAPSPDWARLEPYQETITRADFLKALDTVYAPNGAWKEVIDLGPTSATVHAPGQKQAEFRLQFAPNAASARPTPRYWTPAGARKATPKKPLQGTTIAIDPGHIGGKWAKMEERWFQIGNSKPVMEGEMVLFTGKLLAQRLEALGAKVVFVRKKAEPVTSLRPKDLRKTAIAELKKQGVTKIRTSYSGPNDPLKMQSVAWQSELLFYRVSEIRSRAQLINEKLKPDLVIALHFNAEGWGDPAKPTLTEVNHLHMLVNGNFWQSELALADMRYDMLAKLLTGAEKEELPLADAVANSLAKATGLPPFTYKSNALNPTGNPYVWARNLLANRLYLCPVVYCEPYVMNSRAVFDRVQMGDYEGTRVIDGTPRKSIFREYADGVADGVARYFTSRER